MKTTAILSAGWALLIAAAMFTGHVQADSHGLPCNARYVDMGAYYDMRHGFYVTDWWVFDRRGFFCKQFYTRHLDPIPSPSSPVNHPPQPPHKG